MRLTISAVCHPGKMREKNEDICLIDGIFPDRDKGTVAFFGANLRNGPFFTGVFDGMGGISAGDVASRLSAETAKQIWENSACENDFGRLLTEICSAANERVCREMVETRVRMGSTASMIAFHDDSFTASNLGDSPMFMMRGGVLTEIYKAHNEREEYEKIHGPCDVHKKFRLTQHIGVFENECLLMPYVFDGETLPGDRFLICSDGLTDMTEHADLERVLSDAATPTDAVTSLLGMALDAGGKDNISIICIEAVRKSFFKRLFRKK